MTEAEATGAIYAAISDIEFGHATEYEIVTGNGIVLKDLLLDILYEEDVDYRQSKNNRGSFTVYKK